MKARWLFAAAALLAWAHVVMRGLGWGAHTSVIAGMPQSETSWVLGPIYVLAWMAFVALTPVLLFMGVAEGAKSLMILMEDKSKLK